MSDNSVKDLSSLHRYRTELPNLILEMDISVYAMRLYLQLKKIAGDNGVCYYTARDLAQMCRMSAGTVSKAKQELLDKELIRIDTGDKWARDNITIVDMWPANFAYYAQEKEPQPSDHHTITSDHHTINLDHTVITPDHHTITKEEPIKKEPTKEVGEGASAPRTLHAPKTVVFKSPYVDKHRFCDTGYIAAGTGQTAVEVYYERFDVRQTSARLNAVKEDDLMRLCPDLDKLRDVVTAYSRTSYQPGNLKLILDWYRDGIPQHQKAPSKSQHSTNQGVNAIVDYINKRGVAQ